MYSNSAIKLLPILPSVLCRIIAVSGVSGRRIAGAASWQNRLAADRVPNRYVEIQAGLASTQYECLPMPPRTAWSLTEAWGLIDAGPDAAAGPWDDAVASVSPKEPTTNNRQLITDNR